MNVCLLDTVGLLALWDEDDQWHAGAASAFASLAAQKTRLITTTFILLECGNSAVRRPYRSRVNALRLAMMERDDVVTPSDDDWREAWEASTEAKRALRGL